MGLTDKVKNVLTAARAREVFGIRPVSAGRMDALLTRCANVYAGVPDWADAPDTENAVRTVNMAKSICSETARLATLGIGVRVDGARGAWLQEQVDRFFWSLRTWVEYGCALGTIILKPTGDSVDVFFPDRFVVTDVDNGRITGAVFMAQEYSQERARYYTRLERHHFLPDGRYEVLNRCYVGFSAGDRGQPAAIEDTPWAGLADAVTVEGLERPLFGVFTTPMANNVEPLSPMGLPLFAEALEELRDLDVAYSRAMAEIYDSTRIAMIDDRLIDLTGTPVNGPRKVRLPRFFRKVFGSNEKEFYEEINPSLNTDARLTGVNALLSQIGFKCGFSNGYFVFNERSGMVTATQVEADDRRTIQLVKDVRDRLEDALDGLLYAINAFADLYDYAPGGDYEAVYDFGDITYNREEDRARWWSYVIANKVPAWQFFVKFEGMTEEEARAMIAEAAPKEPALFPEE